MIIEKKQSISTDKQIILLQKKFQTIKEQGYIKSIKTGASGIGVTFEYLIDKKLDNSSTPDFFNIEIKTKRTYSKSHVNLININPTGPAPINNEINRLKNIYGYRDLKDQKLKKLNIVINGKRIEKVGTKFLFKLNIDRNQRKIYIIILDNNLNFIEKRIFWNFDILKERIYQKLNVLALVHALVTKRNGIEYFKYYKINFYILKDFDIFLNLIESGKIKVAIKLGNYYTKEKYGTTNSHGITFIIKEKDIHELFDIYK